MHTAAFDHHKYVNNDLISENVESAVGVSLYIGIFI
jgi:hypothetical protein